MFSHCWFVGVCVNKLTYKVWWIFMIHDSCSLRVVGLLTYKVWWIFMIQFGEYSWFMLIESGRPWDRESSIRLCGWSAFRATSRNITSSVLICNMWNSTTLLLFTRCQHYNADCFSEEFNINTAFQFKHILWRKYALHECLSCLLCSPPTRGHITHALCLSVSLLRAYR